MLIEDINKKLTEVGKAVMNPNLPEGAREKVQSGQMVVGGSVAGAGASFLKDRFIQGILLMGLMGTTNQIAKEEINKLIPLNELRITALKDIYVNAPNDSVAANARKELESTLRESGIERDQLTLYLDNSDQQRSEFIASLGAAQGAGLEQAPGESLEKFGARGTSESLAQQQRVKDVTVARNAAQAEMSVLAGRQTTRPTKFDMPIEDEIAIAKAVQAASPGVKSTDLTQQEIDVIQAKTAAKPVIRSETGKPIASKGTPQIATKQLPNTIYNAAGKGIASTQIPASMLTPEQINALKKKRIK